MERPPKHRNPEIIIPAYETSFLGASSLQAPSLTSHVCQCRHGGLESSTALIALARHQPSQSSLRAAATTSAETVTSTQPTSFFPASTPSAAVSSMVLRATAIVAVLVAPRSHVRGDQPYYFVHGSCGPNRHCLDSWSALKRLTLHEDHQTGPTTTAQAMPIACLPLWCRRS